MAPSNLAAQEFKALRDEANAGRLSMRDGAAEQCAAECVRYATELRAIRSRIASRPLVNPEHFGGFHSGLEVGKKFRNLVEGTGTREPSILQRLDERIAMVEEMAETYRRAGAAYREQDAASASNLRDAGRRA